jgi:glutamyl-Q tRNA(Asp) synthetase
MSSYRGRFAPSPTGPLHAGSLVAALASWLDARAHRGVWLVRFEDVDGLRCMAGGAGIILSQLAALGLIADEPPTVQSLRGAAYQAAVDGLVSRGLAYRCACSRRDIEEALAARGDPRPRFGELVYPGTCRTGLNGKPPRALRFRAESVVRFVDRRCGEQVQDVAAQVGDFVLHRADGIWAYQLAVVVDDAAQAVSHVVRGEDLLDNTARQILLQRALQHPQPSYLHTPLVMGEDGHKLSKQNGALALDTTHPVTALKAAAKVLGLPDIAAATPAEWLAEAVEAWAGIIGGFSHRISP